MENDLNTNLKRMLHRCAFLQMAIREGLPPIGIAVQARHLQTILDELIPQLDTAQDQIIAMNAIDEATENGLMYFLGVTDADTD